ncbi:hypothetical protein [Mycobacteroides chelonae]|uniref:hypothetical protein n=1 Tax=Mycobacteroides chelonae TaxID=1774 RepID=UPI0004AB9B98|nr:hypothetical protein [Mycobacteroides chelonae]OHT67820.1 hypothetical protein BKG66_24670 [Mycobacteroides chelonae]OHT69463.1 hypothetical protein BKG67_23205 [Mycobacteroides chelonae]
MDGPSKSLILGTDPNAYHAALDGAVPVAAVFESTVSSFEREMNRPGGTYWQGATAEAGQGNAHSGWMLTAKVKDIVDRYNAESAPIIDHTIIENLNSAKQIITKCEEQGVQVTDDLKLHWTAPEGMSKEAADANAKVVQEAEARLREHADKWWGGVQQVKGMVDRAKGEVSNTLNTAAGTFDVGAAVKAAALAPGSISQQLTTINAAPVPEDPKTLGDKLKTSPANVTDHIPDQEVAKKDQKLGTTTGKGVDKGDDGRHETPIGTSNKGKFGNFTKIEEPKGPTVWKGKTGEQSGELYKKEFKGHILGGDYDASTRVGAYDAGASAELKKTGATAEEHAGAYAINNQGNIHWDLGDNGSAGRIEAKIHGNAGVAEYGNAGATGNSGFTVGGGGNAGLNGGQELSYHSEPVDIKLGVEEYGGAGAGSHLTFAETEDHKWRVGGSWGYAWGLGAKPGFEVTVDPVVVGKKVAELWNWVMN